MAFVIDLQKEAFKFSCSHFTIFGATEAERLHGHNYYVSCQIEIPILDETLEMAFDFNSIKPKIKAVCELLDEYVLIPVQSPFLKVKDAGAQIEVTFRNKFYSFPKEDVRLLPLSNITAEALARYLSRALEVDVRKLASGSELSVSVKETLGQGVCYRHALK